MSGFSTSDAECTRRQRVNGSTKSNTNTFAEKKIVHRRSQLRPTRRATSLDTSVPLRYERYIAHEAKRTRARRRRPKKESRVSKNRRAGRWLRHHSITIFSDQCVSGVMREQVGGPRMYARSPPTSLRSTGGEVYTKGLGEPVVIAGRSKPRQTAPSPATKSNKSCTRRRHNPWECPRAKGRTSAVGRGA